MGGERIGDGESSIMFRQILSRCGNCAGESSVLYKYGVSGRVGDVG